MSDPILHPLLALIKEQNLIDDLQLEEVMQEQARIGKNCSQILVDFEMVDMDTQLELIARQLGTQVVNLSDRELAAEILQTDPASTARMYQCMPVEVSGSTVQVALAEPLNPSTVDELAYIVRKDIQLVVADPTAIEKLIEKHYGDESESVGDILKELSADTDIAKEASAAAATEDAADMTNLANDVPIVRLVNLVLAQAVQDRASDIHFEPFEDEFKIRYRVDGALYEMAPPPKHLALPVISRIKGMANMNISERRLPQDGRITFPMGTRQVDLRVSTLPTQFGESVVLRVLDRAAMSLEMETLGLPKYIFDYIVEAVQQPNGIFIVTGPTGSGKTTTLYSCLRRVNTIDSKLLTAEEPVEYDLEGIVQVPVNDAIGVTFARVLRSFLREHSDRIWVTEPRALSTAQIVP